MSENAPVGKSAKNYISGTGRRKTAIARVRICPGQGKTEINHQPMNVYFPSQQDRESAIFPLKVSGLLGRVDLFATVQGGGKHGQVGAIIMGLARALIKFDESVESKLRDHRLLTRDARMKERKKFGLHGARRGCQFSKR